MKSICFLLSAFCLLPSAFCLLPTAYRISGEFALAELLPHCAGYDKMSPPTGNGKASKFKK
jgi:hypothetical protein